MNILTCNIRYFGAQDGDNGWAYRKELCAEVIADSRDGRFPSDHYFVGATVEIGA